MKDGDKKREPVVGTGSTASELRRAVKALKETQELYRSALDHMLEGFQIIGSDWRYLYVNDTVAGHGRQAKEKLLGHTMMEMYPGIEKTEMFALLRECMSKRTSHSIKNEFTFPDGSVGWFDLRIEPVPEGVLILSVDITEREEMEKALRESEDKYRNLVERANDGVCILQEGNVRYCNRRLAELWGGDVAEVIGSPFLDFVHPESLEEVALRYKRRMAGKDVPAVYEVILKRRDGAKVFAEINAGIIEYEGKPADMAIIRDITERKKMEQAIQGYNRALRVLSMCNQVVVHSASESELLNEVCRVIVEEGGYVMAWVGFAERDRAKTVRPAACCGCDEGYLKTTRITWSDTKRGRGPTGTAIRTGKPSVIQDIVNDSSYTPWREQATQRGFASSIALPLIAEGRTLGALNIYAVQSDAFDQAEVKLLAELANDLAYGITALRVRQERDWAEERLRTYLENAPDGVFIISAQDGTIVYSNRRAEEISGYEKKDSIGHSFLDLHMIAPEYEAESKRMLKRNALGKGTGPNEYELIRKDGSRVSVEISATPVKQDDGYVVIGIIRDITERKQAAEALQVEKNKLQSVLGAMEYGLTVSMEDTDYNIVYQNEMTKKIFGDHMGEKCYRAYEGGDRVCDGCAVEKAFEDGKSHTSERRLVMPSGEIAFWEVVANPIRDAEGKLVSCLEIGRNVTEQKQAEEALRESEKFLDSVIENTPNPIWVSDEKGTVIRMNRALRELLKITDEEIIGKYNVLKDRQVIKQGYLPLVKSVFEKGETVSFTLNYDTAKETQLELAETTQRVVEIVISAVKDADGKVIHAICQEKDITEQEQAREALRKSQERLSLAVEGTNLGLWDWMVQTGEVVFNERWADIVGYTLEELAPVDINTWAKLVHPDDLKRSDELLKKHFAGESEYYECEARMKHKNGEWIWVLDKGKVVEWDKGGKPVRMAGTHLDITEPKRAREARLRSEANLEEAQRVAKVGSWERNLETGINSWSLEMYNLMGFDPAKGLPSFDDFLVSVHPKDRRAVRSFNERVLMTGQPDSLEFRSNPARGPVRFFLSRIDTARDAEGRVTKLLGTLQDITEQKRAGEALRESEANLAEAQRVAKMGSWRQDIATGDSVWSAELYNINRCDPTLPLPQFDDFLEMLHPEDRHLLAEVSAGVAKTGQPGTVEFRSNPALGPVRYFLGNVELIRDAEGHPVALSGTQQDITEMKRAEEALRQSEEKLRTTLESIPEGVTVTGLDGIILQVNNAVLRLHGFDSPQAMVGKHAGQFVAEEDRARAEDNKNKVLKTGLSSTFECALLRRDGSRFSAELSLAVIKDDLGKPRGLVSISQDITERKQMAEKLMMTDRLASVGELASGIAHELNNPLTSVIGLAELLQESDMPDDIKEDLGTVYSEAQRAAQVVKNLLTFARKHPSQKHVVNLNEVINKVLELRAYEQRVHNIEVVTNLAADLPSITADYFQLQQVFLNIIINAEYFMIKERNKGTLTITTERAGDIVRASFADDGPGIARENLGHLFDPFFTTKEVGKGTGLGLSICHGIITEHSGTIYAESELGEGATFVVELPVE